MDIFEADSLRFFCHSACCVSRLSLPKIENDLNESYFSMPLLSYFVFTDRNSLPFESSQTLIKSPLADVSERPSLLNATPPTGSSCPRNTLISRPVRTSQIRTVLSA